jgi:hypothetical protein
MRVHGRLLCHDGKLLQTDKLTRGFCFGAKLAAVTGVPRRRWPWAIKILEEMKCYTTLLYFS